MMLVPITGPDDVQDGDRILVYANQEATVVSRKEMQKHFQHIHNDQICFLVDDHDYGPRVNCHSVTWNSKSLLGKIVDIYEYDPLQQGDQDDCI